VAHPSHGTWARSASSWQPAKKALAEHSIRPPSSAHLKRQWRSHMVECVDRPAPTACRCRGFLAWPGRCIQATLVMAWGRRPKGDVLAVARVAAIQAAKRNLGADSPLSSDASPVRWSAHRSSGRWLRTAGLEGQRPHQRAPGVEMEGPSPPFRWAGSPSTPWSKFRRSPP